MKIYSDIAVDLAIDEMIALFRREEWNLRQWIVTRPETWSGETVTLKQTVTAVSPPSE